MASATEAAARAFFTSPNFAVVGASNDPSKFGHKIFTWYITHGLPTTPINARAPTITLENQTPEPQTTKTKTKTKTKTETEIRTYATLPSVAALPSPRQTSLSFVTPPPITRAVLREARDRGVPAVWLQPGSYDAEGWDFAVTEFAVAVAGEGVGAGHEGWCVLVDGERAMEGAGRVEGKL